MAVLGMAAVAVSSAAPVWGADLEEALEKAGKSGRPALVDFTGSDRCSGCIYLGTKIFDTEGFARYMEDNNFMPVELEYLKTARDADPESHAAKKLEPWMDYVQKHMSDWK